jgi:hypothetical protein
LLLSAAYSRRAMYISSSNAMVTLFITAHLSEGGFLQYCRSAQTPKIFLCVSIT